MKGEATRGKEKVECKEKLTWASRFRAVHAIKRAYFL